MHPAQVHASFATKIGKNAKNGKRLAAAQSNARNKEGERERERGRDLNFPEHFGMVSGLMQAGGSRSAMRWFWLLIQTINWRLSHS